MLIIIINTRNERKKFDNDQAQCRDQIKNRPNKFNEESTTKDKAYFNRGRNITRKNETLFNNWTKNVEILVL